MRNPGPGVVEGATAAADMAGLPGGSSVPPPETEWERPVAQTEAFDTLL